MNTVRVVLGKGFVESVTFVEGCCLEQERKLRSKYKKRKKSQTVHTKGAWHTALLRFKELMFMLVPIHQGAGELETGTPSASFRKGLSHSQLIPLCRTNS